MVPNKRTFAHPWCRTRHVSGRGSFDVESEVQRSKHTDTQGTCIVCDGKGLGCEEAPAAYKDVEAVGQDLVDVNAAHIVGWFRARIRCRVRNGTH